MARGTGGREQPKSRMGSSLHCSGRIPPRTPRRRDAVVRGVLQASNARRRDMAEFDGATEMVNSGLRAAETCGYAIARLDLLCTKATIEYAAGAKTEAVQRAKSVAEEAERIAYFWGSRNARIVLALEDPK